MTICKKLVFYTLQNYINGSDRIIMLNSKSFTVEPVKASTVGDLSCGSCGEKCPKFGPLTFNLSGSWQG